MKDIQKVDVVGVKRAKLLAWEAGRSIVQVKVKIWDIRQTKDGPAIDVLDVIPRRGLAEGDRLSREPIALWAEDHDAIKGCGTASRSR